MDWRLLAIRLQNTFDKLSSKVFQGDGFSVRTYSRYGLTYCESGRRLTLMTGDEERTNLYGRTWLVFPTTETLIFVPNFPMWDDGQPLTEEEKILATARICDTFKKRKEPHRLVVGDDLYEQMWRGIQSGGVAEN